MAPPCSLPKVPQKDNVCSLSIFKVSTNFLKTKKNVHSVQLGQNSLSNRMNSFDRPLDEDIGCQLRWTEWSALVTRVPFSAIILANSAPIVAVYSTKRK